MKKLYVSIHSTCARYNHVLLLLKLDPSCSRVNMKYHASDAMYQNRGADGS